MTDMIPNSAEAKRLDKIGEAFNNDLLDSISNHFNGAVTNAFTPDEDKENLNAIDETQKALEKSSKLLAAGNIFRAEIYSSEATLASLKPIDLFMRVARRVGSDAEIAACLPPRKSRTFFPRRSDKKDAAVLEKYELKSLAAVIRAKL